MQTAPLSLGTFHIVGIGGIGMSGIAEVLHHAGHTVQGSDQGENANTIRLQKLGIKTVKGHDPKLLEKATVVVRSSAIKDSDPDIKLARKLGIPIMSRADMLAEIMRFKSTVCLSGTHGKTTMTSLMSTLFLKAGLDPTILNGGILFDINSNARAGTGNWMVVESDESDKTFIKIPRTIAVISNIEPEHMENYDDDFAVLKQAFVEFANGVPAYGFSIVCIDHPTVKAILPKIHKPTITYGTDPKAQCRATNIRASEKGMTFDVTFDKQKLKDVEIPLLGEHNMLNALTVVVVGLKLNLSENIIKKSLREFAGVKRRFVTTGTTDGITVIDDYAHHPTEIAAVLKAARLMTKNKIIAVVQPHKYSRLKNLFSEFSKCFEGADTLILAPVYEAGESPLKGYDSNTLADAAKTHFKGEIHVLSSEKDLPALVKKLAHKGDLITCMGAGTISEWAYALPEQLKSMG
ncbi:MAG: UDP-N-acetylmuramate--L-alanine ligase [Holosporaceae bacterium]|nr:MAG: UDP-N-acetylmuramate--L-alanine ligase [Holosporaceae bacterium]